MAFEYAKDLRGLIEKRTAMYYDMPKEISPEIMKMRLAEVDAQIAAIKQLFYGKKKEKTTPIVMEIEPTSVTLNTTTVTLEIGLLYQGEEGGFYPVENTDPKSNKPLVHLRAGMRLAEKPEKGQEVTTVSLVLENLNKPYDSAEMDTTNGFQYLLPAMVTAHIMKDKEILATEDLTIAQLGTRICLPRWSGSWLKTTLKVTLDPQTGCLRTIDTASKGINAEKIAKANEAAKAVANMPDSLAKLEAEKKRLQLESEIEALRNPAPKK